MKIIFSHYSTMNVIWLWRTQKYVDFEAMGESKVYFFLFLPSLLKKTWEVLSFLALRSSAMLVFQYLNLNWTVNIREERAPDQTNLFWGVRQPVGHWAPNHVKEH